MNHDELQSSNYTYCSPTGMIILGSGKFPCYTRFPAQQGSGKFPLLDSGKFPPGQGLLVSGRYTVLEAEQAAINQNPIVVFDFDSANLLIASGSDFD